MVHFFMSGGLFMWPLLILAVAVFIISVKKTRDLFGRKQLSQTQPGNGINAILFWGGLSAVIGVFAHFLGVYEAMRFIAKANDISPAIVTEGYAVSLTTILFGLFIFMFAAIIWFVLRWKYEQLMLKPE